MARAPDRALRIAVKGMLPKNSLGAAMLRKLKIFARRRARRTPPSSRSR